MNREIHPPGIAAPAANYAHAVLSDHPARMLHTSGAVATSPDGTVPDSVAEQAVVIWATLTALLTEAGMTPADVVSVTTYVVDGQELAPVMAARDTALGGHRAASTLIVVPRLARPEWLMEIALVAGR